MCQVLAGAHTRQGSPRFNVGNEPTRDTDCVRQLVLGPVQWGAPGTDFGAEAVMGERLGRLGSNLSHGMSVAYRARVLALMKASRVAKVDAM